MQKWRLEQLPDNLLNETDGHKFLHKTILSEENPPESPSESSRCLLEVHWDLSFTVTLGNNIKLMDTKVTNNNKYNWGNSLWSDSTRKGKVTKLNPLEGSLNRIQGLPTSDPWLLNNGLSEVYHF